MVCCAIADRKRNPVSLSMTQFRPHEESEQDAEEHAEHDEIGAVGV